MNDVTLSDTNTLEVGQRLRELRLSRGMTIRAAADASGLSVNTLSLIENGHTSPSVSTLQALARALGVSLSAFFTEPEVQQQVIHLRASERSITETSTAQLEPLARGLTGSGIQPFVVHLPAGAHSGEQPIKHGGVELIYCLAGKVVVMVDSRTYLLEPGDSLAFDSNLSHAWRNPEKDMARFLLILCPGEKLETPTKRHFGVDE